VLTDSLRELKVNVRVLVDELVEREGAVGREIDSTRGEESVLFGPSGKEREKETRTRVSSSKYIYGGSVCAMKSVYLLYCMVVCKVPDDEADGLDLFVQTDGEVHLLTQVAVDLRDRGARRNRRRGDVAERERESHLYRGRRRRRRSARAESKGEKEKGGRREGRGRRGRQKRRDER